MSLGNFLILLRILINCTNGKKKYEKNTIKKMNTLWFLNRRIERDKMIVFIILSLLWNQAGFCWVVQKNRNLYAIIILHLIGQKKKILLPLVFYITDYPDWLEWGERGGDGKGWGEECEGKRRRRDNQRQPENTNPGYSTSIHSTGGYNTSGYFNLEVKNIPIFINRGELCQ